MSTNIRFVHEPSVAFRGTRNYVHSTDLYEEILIGAKRADLTVEGPIDLRIHQRMNKEPILTFATAVEESAGVPARCTFNGNSELWRAVITQSERFVTKQKPYDEARIWSRCRLEGRATTIDADVGARPIETVTALAVFLHKNVLPPPPERRWMLGQLMLVRPLAAIDSRTMTITLDRVVGRVMTRSQIVASDGRIGSMIFILG